ncbi:MAG: LamG domain-containing protein [Kiritimatiellae bacterium]|nr:LamG domain-containing protein [Kiritimatiellia bacterium]
MNAKRMPGVAGWFVCLALGAGLSQATITVDGYFRLGEDDPGAAAGQPGQNPTRETSSLTALSIVGAGAPTNTAASSTAAIQHAGSTLAMRFDGASYYVTNGVLNTATNDYGIEAWFRPDLVTNWNQGIVANGHHVGNNSHCLYLIKETIYGLHASGWVSSGVKAVTGVWYHVAFVVTNGIGCVYVNGTLCATQNVAGIGNVPASNFSIGAEANGANKLRGEIDEVRIFHFAPGAFRDSDLLYRVTPAASTLYTRTVLAADPVAYYRLNEGEGARAFDIATNPAPSAQQGAQTGFYRKNNVRSLLPLVVTNGPCQDIYPGLEAGNTAPCFNGTGGQLAGADTDNVIASLPGIATDYAIEGWVCNARSNNILSITGYVWGRGTNAAFDALGIGGTWGGPPLVGSLGKLFAFNSSGEGFVGTTLLSLNTWYHVAFVRSGTTVSIYLNGKLENSGTMSATAGSSDFVFGFRPDFGWTFKGALDEIAVYNRVLSADEIRAHYVRATRFEGTTILLR